MNWRAFAESFVTLVVIMDPLGSAPIFITLTAGRTAAARRRAALEAAAAAGGLVVVFALFGRLILDYLHVSVESLTIAGGMLLLLVALQMLRGEEMAQQESGADRIVRGEDELVIPGQVSRAFHFGDHGRVIGNAILTDHARGEAAPNHALVHEGGAAGELTTAIEERQPGGGPAAAG